MRPAPTRLPLLQCTNAGRLPASSRTASTSRPNVASLTAPCPTGMWRYSSPAWSTVSGVLNGRGSMASRMSISTAHPARFSAARCSEAGCPPVTIPGIGSQALGRLRAQRLDFIIQTTATKGNRAELERIAQWSAEQGAVAFNCYFLVATGRGAGMSDLAPAEYEVVLADLALWQRQYRGQMMVRAKCAPHFMRHVHAADRDSPILNYETRCPCGTQYCRITPDGKLTPCPYLPEVAGDLRTRGFAEIWRSAPLFREIG